MFATKGQKESMMSAMCEEKGIEYIGKTYSDVYDALKEKYDLHNQKEIQEMANEFINDFIDEFSEKELIVWYEVNHSTFSDKDLKMKYYNTLKICESFVKFWTQKKQLKYTIEYYFFGDEVKKAYNQLGLGFYTNNDFIQEITIQLWGIIKTIRDSMYNTQLIQALQEEIKNLLFFCGNSYYLEKDLTDKKVLKQLYYELCEVTHHSDGFKGHELFYDYDGYGNTINALTGEIKEEW